MSDQVATPASKLPRILSSSLIHQARIFSIRNCEVELPNGQVVTRTMLAHPGAAVIIPQLPDGRLLLIRQYRFAVEREIFEFPAGTLNPGEAPRECAEREIVEETGYAASSWHPLGELLPAPGFADELQHGFFASDLRTASAPKDEDEFIEVIPLAVGEIERLIASGKLVDAKSIGFFFRARLQGFL